jgi:hypothetical protein
VVTVVTVGLKLFVQCLWMLLFYKEWPPLYFINRPRARARPRARMALVCPTGRKRIRDRRPKLPPCAPWPPCDGGLLVDSRGPAVRIGGWGVQNAKHSVRLAGGVGQVIDGDRDRTRGAVDRPSLIVKGAVGAGNRNPDPGMIVRPRVEIPSRRYARGSWVVKIQPRETGNSTTFPLSPATDTGVLTQTSFSGPKRPMGPTDLSKYPVRIYAAW